MICVRVPRAVRPVQQCAIELIRKVLNMSKELLRASDEDDEERAKFQASDFSRAAVRLLSTKDANATTARCSELVATSYNRFRQHRCVHILFSGEERLDSGCGSGRREQLSEWLAGARTERIRLEVSFPTIDTRPDVLHALQKLTFLSAQPLLLGRFRPHGQ